MADFFGVIALAPTGLAFLIDHVALVAG